MKRVWNIKPTLYSNRSGEGSFIRLKNEMILFAYSSHRNSRRHNSDVCDIAVIRSKDEGETWSEPEIIVRADDYGVDCISNVSAMYQQNGNIALYYTVSEINGSAGIGRASSKTGRVFTPERCEIVGPAGCYRINNDRFIRLDDGRIAVAGNYYIHDPADPNGFGICVLMTSNDDGKTFFVTPPRLTIPKTDATGIGMQDPGIIQQNDGAIRLWARTSKDRHYECYSKDGGNAFTLPAPSPFPCNLSSLEMAQNGNATYALYQSATGYIIQKSTDGGKSWGSANVIEDDPECVYHDPALFFTKDNALLCAYSHESVSDKLRETDIAKISLDELK